MTTTNTQGAHIARRLSDSKRPGEAEILKVENLQVSFPTDEGPVNVTQLAFEEAAQVQLPDVRVSVTVNGPPLADGDGQSQRHGRSVSRTEHDRRRTRNATVTPGNRIS